MNETPVPDDLVQVVHRGPVSRPDVGIPVLATLRSRDGREIDRPATALAWTAEAVEVAWLLPGHGLRLATAWIAAGDARRGTAVQDRLNRIYGAATGYVASGPLPLPAQSPQTPPWLR